MSRHGCLDNVKFDILLLAITHCIYLVGTGCEKATLFYCVPPQWRLWKWDKIMYEFKICSDFNILRFNQPILLSFFFFPLMLCLFPAFLPPSSLFVLLSPTPFPLLLLLSLSSFLTSLHFLPIAALTTQWTKEMIICAEKARQLCSIAWTCSHCCPVLGPLSSFSSFFHILVCTSFLPSLSAKIISYHHSVNKWSMPPP